MKFSAKPFVVLSLFSALMMSATTASALGEDEVKSLMKKSNCFKCHAIGSPLSCTLPGKTVCAPFDRSSSSIGPGPGLIHDARNCRVRGEHGAAR